MFEQIIVPSIDGIVTSRKMPARDMAVPFVRCNIPCIGANESSENPDSIDCDISLNAQASAHAQTVPYSTFTLHSE
jgi:hypothetical protein